MCGIPLSTLSALFLLCLLCVDVSRCHALQQQGSSLGQDQDGKSRQEQEQQQQPQRNQQKPAAQDFEQELQPLLDLTPFFWPPSSLLLHSPPPLIALPRPSLQLTRRHSSGGHRDSHENKSKRKTKNAREREKKRQQSVSSKQSGPQNHKHRINTAKVKSDKKHKKAPKQPQTKKIAKTKDHTNNHHEHGPHQHQHPGQTFRQSTFRRKGKLYLYSQEDDWYNKYRNRNRSGPNAVMRKLTLASSRRRKAVVTLDPTSSGANSLGSIEQEYGSPNPLPGSLGGGGGGGGAMTDLPVVQGDTQSNKGDTDDSNNNGVSPASIQTEAEIQAVKRPKPLGSITGPVPRPIIIRPAGLIPKARSSSPGGRETLRRDAAQWTRTISAIGALLFAVASLV